MPDFRAPHASRPTTNSMFCDVTCQWIRGNSSPLRAGLPAARHLRDRAVSICVEVCRHKSLSLSPSHSLLSLLVSASMGARPRPFPCRCLGGMGARLLSRERAGVFSSLFVKRSLPCGCPCWSEPVKLPCLSNSNCCCHGNDRIMMALANCFRRRVRAALFSYLYLAGSVSCGMGLLLLVPSLFLLPWVFASAILPCIQHACPWWGDRFPTRREPLRVVAMASLHQGDLPQGGLCPRLRGCGPQASAHVTHTVYCLGMCCPSCILIVEIFHTTWVSVGAMDREALSGCGLARLGHQICTPVLPTRHHSCLCRVLDHLNQSTSGKWVQLQYLTTNTTMHAS